ncbi:MAG: hypothetical protein B1H11_06640 [Desulfobacteraceae bacterium 4484_190.1]|nr:MAG: hypothetical protein B1H11_06640 [Desulfobacteraceae bacterium 4484_190.1]
MKKIAIIGQPPQAVLKGVTIPAWGNAQEKNYIFPGSPERAIHKNKYHALSALIGNGLSKPQDIAPGWYI